jgi:hypothetical protein
MSPAGWKMRAVRHTAERILALMLLVGPSTVRTLQSYYGNRQFRGALLQNATVLMRESLSPEAGD